MRTLGVAVSILVILASAWMGLNFLAWGRLTGAPTKWNLEEIAKEGQPIAQAISDYQSDHGVLPIGWSDIVPRYLPKMPQGWEYDEGLLDHFSGLPHTRVACRFDGSSGHWELIGEYAQGRVINVPGPVVKKVSVSADVVFTNQLAQFEKRITADPRETFNYRQKIEFLARSQGNDQALAECKRAAQLFPNWWYPPMVTAVLLTNNLQAEQSFKSWVEAHPTFIHYWYLSRFYREKDNYDAAFAALEKAAGGSFTSYDQEIAESQRQLRVAVQLAAAGKSSPAPAVNDSDDDYWWNSDGFAVDAVRFCCEQRKYPLAQKIMDHCGIKDSPFKAIAELGLGQFDDATNDARAIARANMAEPGSSGMQPDWPLQTPLFLEVANARCTNFYFGEREDDDRDWALLSVPYEKPAGDGDSAEAALHRAFQNQQKGDLEAAIADGTKAIQLKPMLATGYNLRAWAEFLKGDFDPAINDASRAIHLNLNFGNAYGTRGWARYSKGDTNAALEDLKTAIELCGESSLESIEDHGLIEFVHGNNEKATAFWQNAIQLNPSAQGQLEPWIAKAGQRVSR